MNISTYSLSALGMPIFLGLMVCVVVMTLAWVWQIRSRDAGVVDFCWAALIGLLSISYAFSGEGYWLRRLIIAMLLGIWSYRLSAYLLRDRVLSEEEDGRYVALRSYLEGRGSESWVQFYFFLFFQAQAVLAIFFAVPALVISQNPIPYLAITDYLALIIWVSAFYGEYLSDKQLEEYRHNSGNRGKTCRVGLWRYSRHPNYFFEWMMWVSYALLALSGPQGYLVFLAPVVMYYLITRVTGIPYTEKQALRKRGDDYRHYQESTSAFFPWFPGRASSTGDSRSAGELKGAGSYKSEGGN